MNGSGKTGPFNAYLRTVKGVATRNEGVLVVASTFALVALIIVVGHVTGGQYCLESRRRAWVAQDLVGGLSRGREALVGSLEMPPLPTLAVAALGMIPFVGFSASGSIVSGLAAGLLALYVNKLWKRGGISRALRYPSMACLLLLPPVALSIQFGQSTMLLVALVLCGLGFLVTWLRERSLCSLRHSAVLLGLATAVRPQTIVVVLAGLVVAAVVTACAERKLSAIKKTSVTFFAPTFYVVLLWLAGNWLFLGNPVFFLKGLPTAISAGAPGCGGFLSRNCDWAAVAAIAPLVLTAPLVSFVARGVRGVAARHVAAGGSLLLTVVVVLAAGISARPGEGDAEIPHVVNALGERYPGGTFIVSGYEGYEFVEAAAEDTAHQWVHLMHLDPPGLTRVLRERAETDVYVLVQDKKTPDLWQDLGLHWKAPHSRIPERFLFADRVGSWAVFECLRGR